MLTVYARKIPEGVAIFRDAAAQTAFCTFTHANHHKVPDRRNKWVTLNCYRWRLVWLNQATTP